MAELKRFCEACGKEMIWAMPTAGCQSPPVWVHAHSLQFHCGGASGLPAAWPGTIMSVDVFASLLKQLWPSLARSSRKDLWDTISTYAGGAQALNAAGLALD